ncbi:glycosyltransferase family 4 protein [Leptothoe spongobia TAU-MAC 1115]|uniref:Glycosyltransferase family 4 protein n=2 Tax=Leptothoe TaxID=2651725 RepID=A0A947GM14_9CYAN|nr:glycosyltransferase family 4 protein [Leptothoe spongobia TAU-MAC 1115]
MNLLYTLTAYPPSIGGAQLHQHLLAQQLGESHAIQVASFWNANRTDWLWGTTMGAHRNSYDYTIDNINVRRLGFHWLEKLKMSCLLPFYYPCMSVALPLLSRSIISHLRELAQSVDLIHNVRIGREGLTYASWQLARQRHIPFLLTPVHHPRWVGWRYCEYIKLYRQADAVIALTVAEKGILSGLGVSPDRIHVTGHGPVLAAEANPDRFRQKYQLQNPIVLFLGQHYPYKGYVQLLTAATSVWCDHPDTEFVFIGPSVKQSENIFQTCADPRIHRLGKVSLQEKTDALAACTLLCVPSIQESFGGVYTEAWSFKKPVIGCPIPAVSELITDEVDGCLVTQQADAIADRINYLLSNSGVAAKLGLAGHRKVQANYTWSRLAEKTAQIYQSVCKNG